MANTLGVVLSSFAGGFLLDLAGPQAALAFATLTGAGGMGLVWVLLGREGPCGRGPARVKDSLPLP